VLLAIAVGLGSGLLLALPLTELLKGDLLGQTRRLANPFSGWTGLGDREVVILGTDVGGGNTDVMYTLRVQNGITKLTQVPRDTYIDSSSFGPLKANALYAMGGPEAVKSELSRHLGRPVDHHILVNLSVIRRLGDALGGLEVDVPKAMYYVDNSQGLSIDLQPGRQRLQGHDLEGFLRFRHDEMGDIGRLDRQKLVLKALFEQITRPENLVRLPALLAAAGKDLKTDLGPMEIGGLITAALSSTPNGWRAGLSCVMAFPTGRRSGRWPLDRPPSAAAASATSSCSDPDRPLAPAPGTATTTPAPPGLPAP
jgi:LCP family protein required for cell wall assembly